ncbi:MAG: selenide, water dikinase SelD [Gemmataceae bacterium]
MEPIRLTQLTKRGGCASKQPPGNLFPLLAQLPAITDPRVLVGTATADDAAIYQLSDDIALVLTTDFFTPVVDDPTDFGAIAAANALSDVYAMGGTPTTALSLVGFPDTTVPLSVLGDILKGAHQVAAEAGIAIVGGHSIRTEEPIFGLAVVGTVHPKKVRTNAHAQVGDVLILTKPLGVGIIASAAKSGEDTLGAIGAAITQMKTLNRAAGEAFATGPVNALTDVTGFGLLGHLRNIVMASNVVAEVSFGAVPILSAAREYAARGIAPGGSHANKKFVAATVDYAEGIADLDQLLLCDAQTSGGLLAAVPEASAASMMAALEARGVNGHVIGRIVASGEGRIRVVA